MIIVDMEDVTREHFLAKQGFVQIPNVNDEVNILLADGIDTWRVLKVIHSPISVEDRDFNHAVPQVTLEVALVNTWRKERD